MIKKDRSQFNTFFLVAACICAATGAYVFFFYDKPISLSTADWGSFGSYFGGILTFVSIILLYKNLSEQRIENHRNWFDAGFMRRIQATISYIEENKVFIQCMCREVVQSCNHSLYDEDCKSDDAIIELSNLYVDNITEGRTIYEGLYYKFKSIVDYISFDSYFEDNQKDSYFQEFEHCLNKESIVSILCVMSNLDDKETIHILSKHHVFLHFQTENPGFDVVKDGIFKYSTIQKS